MRDFAIGLVSGLLIGALLGVISILEIFLGWHT